MNRLRVVAFWVMAMSVVVVAQTSKEPLRANMTASKIVVRDGVEKKEPANVVKPGDVIRYSVEYHNQSDHTLKDVRGTLPIPVGMTYLGGSALPGGVWASTNGADFAPAPLKRKQKNAAGVETEVPVPLEEYRALRWNMGEIAAGQAKTVSARVRVTSSTGSASAPSSH